MKKNTIVMPIYLTPEQKRYVIRAAKKLCVTQSEVVRLAIQEAIEGEKNE